MRPEPFIYAPPQDPVLSVIYEDHDLLVLDKPSGLLSVPGKGEGHDDCLEARAQARYPDARIVHRLDMSTSGVIVLARNAVAHRNLGLQFERRKTSKHYIARVYGHIEQNEGLVDLPLICDWPNRPKQMVCHTRGKPAQTNWDVLEREMGDIKATRVKLSPITGRSHQLRVHMLALGHVILGDDFYATGEALEAADRLQLHAQSLTLHHPEDGRLITFTSPCPF